MPITPAIPEYEIIAPHEALISWKNNRVTQQVAAILSQEKDSSYRRVGNGETLGDNVIQDTARAVGYVEGLQFAVDLLELHFVVETAEDVDEKQEGSASS